MDFVNSLKKDFAVQVRSFLEIHFSFYKSIVKKDKVV